MPKFLHGMYVGKNNNCINKRHHSFFNAQLSVAFPHATFSPRNVALGF